MDHTNQLQLRLKQKYTHLITRGVSHELMEGLTRNINGVLWRSDLLLDLYRGYTGPRGPGTAIKNALRIED